MKRSIFCLLCILLIFAVAGCTKTTSQSKFSNETESNTNLDTDIGKEGINSNSEIKIEYVPDSFSFSMSMNVFDYDDGGNLKSVGYKTNIIESEERRYLLSLRVVPDQSMNYDIIPIKLLTIVDGEFIPFSVNSDDKKSLQKTIEVEPGADTNVIISFAANTDMRYITIVACALPEDVPNLGVGLYSGVCTYTIVNENNKTEYSTDLLDNENYFEVSATEDNIGLGIDIKSLQDRQQSESSQYDKDIIYKKNTDKLWVKFNSDTSLADVNTPLNAYYSLFVLCDGEPIPIFNGEYLHTVHTPAEDVKKSSQMAFQFPISDEYIPDDGLHTFQAIAVPNYIYGIQEILDKDPNVLRGLSTPKTRVIIE